MEFVEARSKNDVWQTPTEFIEDLKAHVDIDLDPCAGRDTDHGTVNFRLPETDGLETGWDVGDDTTAFVNPPFSVKVRWLRRAIGQFMVGNADRVIFLTPDSTGAASWWHRYVAAYFDATWFEVSRLDFVVPEGFPELFDYEATPPGEQASGVSFNTALHFLGDFPRSLFADLAERGDLVRRDWGWSQ